ncbi:molybdate ABC transporter substrate-binding protein [Paenibacillus tarimensis]|uniref:molybdate ABC transporter substrate-binding protein n=1 Tax=Paenibacillus tarimensis TaxID=416012 RepID=UPI001F3A2F09|nr:molybdate ABC transporter substrate-binding protein [Paenibacillus tarimensis]MCF2944707.1 molybdate ABC transporter substrate-binding protein [Paenibacillus tarimensis]
MNNKLPGFIRVRPRFFTLLQLMLALLLVSGCTNQDSKADRTELIVSAAASLQDSLRELAAAYEQQHPGVSITLNLGSSGALAKQIAEGAPVDLFLSAGTAPMDKLSSTKTVAGRKQLLLNELVLITPDDKAVRPSKLEDLLNEEIRRIAVGEPDVVPAGEYTRETLEYAGLWAMLKPKLVMAKDVKQVLTYVNSGNADAGFVYSTDAASSSAASVVYRVPEQWHSPIIYEAAVVERSSNRKEAAALLNYMLNEESSDLFRDYGFRIPTEQKE